MATAFVDVIKPAHEGIEVKRKIATMPSRQTGLEAELVDIRAAKRTMPRQTKAAKDSIKALKAQLTAALMAFERLTDEFARI